jgi:hypothetical protein
MNNVSYDGLWGLLWKRVRTVKTDYGPEYRVAPFLGWLPNLVLCLGLTLLLHWRIDWLTWLSASSIGLLCLLITSVPYYISAGKRGAYNKRRGEQGAGPVAFNGEAGWQGGEAELKTGWHIIPPWWFPTVVMQDVPEVAPGGVGALYAQVGNNLPAGRNSGVYKTIFGSYVDLELCLTNGMEKGWQRPVVRPGIQDGSIFMLTFTENRVFGIPITAEAQRLIKDGKPNFEELSNAQGRSIKAENFRQRVIQPVAGVETITETYKVDETKNLKKLIGRTVEVKEAPGDQTQPDGNVVETPTTGGLERTITRRINISKMGVVTVFDGAPRSPDQNAGRINPVGKKEGWEDVEAEEEKLLATHPKPADLGDKPSGVSEDEWKKQVKEWQQKMKDWSYEIGAELFAYIRQSSKDSLTLHQNFTDFQKFVDVGGTNGLQYEGLLEGAYALHPILVRVEIENQLVVHEGEQALIISSVGLPKVDISTKYFTHGSVVLPGHKGIWRVGLQPAKYVLNPVVHSVRKLPTAFFTINNSEAVSGTHSYDQYLGPIRAKTNDPYNLKLDVQTLIAVPEREGAFVIQRFGSAEGLIREGLVTVLDRYLSVTIQHQSLEHFIKNLGTMQEEAEAAVRKHIGEYDVRTEGVMVQEWELEDTEEEATNIIKAMKRQGTAVQLKGAYTREAEAELENIKLQHNKGTAAQQADLAEAEVGVTIAKKEAQARTARGKGFAKFVEAVKDQDQREIIIAVEAMGADNATAKLIAQAVANGTITLPQVMSLGGSSMENVLGTLTSFLMNRQGPSTPPAASTPARATVST